MEIIRLLAFINHIIRFLLLHLKLPSSSFFTHRKRVIHQLPVSRGTWETKQKSGHTEIFIVFDILETFGSVYV